MFPMPIADPVVPVKMYPVNRAIKPRAGEVRGSTRRKIVFADVSTLGIG